MAYGRFGFGTLGQAQNYAEECRQAATVNLCYYAKEMEPDESEVFLKLWQAMGM